MRLTEPRVALTDSEAVLSADLISNGLGLHTLRIGVDRRFVGCLDVGLNPFVPVATMAAALAHENLDVDGPVSPTLASGAEAAGTLFAEWFGYGPVAIHAPLSEPPFPGGGGVGLFYTRGVDSTFSLMRSREGEIPERVTHLIGIAEIDHWVSRATQSAVWRATRESAERLGLPIVRVTTNVRELLDPLGPWDHTHGSVLGSVALLLSPLLHTAVVGSTQRREHEVGYGSHSALDRLWSTERTALRHDGAEFGRHEKVARLARQPEWARSLKVCWIADTPGNCGRCLKCLRTMTAFAAAGIPMSELFAHPLTPDAVRRCDPPTGQYVINEIANDLVPALPAGMVPIRDAWLEWLGQWSTFSSGPRGARATLNQTTRSLATPRALDDVCAAAEVVGSAVVGGASDETTDALMPGWTEGRFPIRFPRGRSSALPATAGDPVDRPVAWCLVDEQSAMAVALADRLNATWGSGICYLAGIPWGGDQPPGLSPEAVSRLLRACRVRLWWSDADDLDAVRVYESVANGCLPLQVMDVGAAESLRPRLPERLRDCVIGVDPDGPPELPDIAEAARRLQQVATELATGSLERDLLVGYG